MSQPINHSDLSALRAHLSCTRSTRPSLCLLLAVSKLPPEEVARELRRLNLPPHRLIAVIADLGSHVTAAQFRNFVLLQDAPNLLIRKPSTTHAARAMEPWKKEMRHLVETWEPLVEGPLRKTLRELVSAFGFGVGALENANGTVVGEKDQGGEEAGRLGRLEKSIARLLVRLAEIETLCGGNASGHDGLREVVGGIWAELRRRRLDLAEFRTRCGENADGVGKVDSIVRKIHEKRDTLSDCGFEIGAVTPGGSENESEGEWEDIVEVGEGDEVEEGIMEEEEEVREEIQLNKVGNWTKVLGGEEGKDANRLILEQIERKGGVGKIEGIDTFAGGSGLSGWEREGNSRRRGRGGRQSRGKKQPSTARQRLSASLGLKKKRKKKNLLDNS